MNRLKRLILFEPLFFSWSQSFLFLTGIVLVIVLPANLPIRIAAISPGIASFFPLLFVLLFAIYAMNFGQSQGDPERVWHKRFGARFGVHVAQLALRLSMLLLLTLPFWLIFYHVFYLRPTATLALLYLWLQGQMWGWFGLWLSVMRFSEINQFKIKYLVLILFFSLTMFVAPLSPFLTLQLLLDPNGLFSGTHLWLSSLSVAATLAALGWGIGKRCKKLEVSASLKLVD